MESESGFLSVFRLFVGIRLIFSALVLVVEQYINNARILRIQASPWPSIIEAALLLGYLSWPWLRIKLGKAYLPIALLVATVGPILENFFAVDLHITDEVTQVRAFAGQWEVVILLLVPLILVSWKYRTWVIGAYCLGTAALDGILTLTLTDVSGINLWPVMSVVFFRTVMYLFIGYVINRLSAEQREQNALLLQANRQLANSAKTLEQLTISRERNRLARELHDTLAHSLSALAVQLEAIRSLWDADPKTARSMLDHSLAMTRDGLNEARRSIQSLRTAPLEDLGLALAIRNLAASQAERGGFSLNLDVPEQVPELDPDVEHSLYRIAEEALRNTTRHSGADLVTVKMDCDERRIDLSISDNGRGFRDGPDITEDHFGLRGMRERAESIGARLAIDSQPDKGTTVRVSMEVKRDTGVNLR
ncbi:MAG: sensor histidine kinase [Chloroflexi bacterium]|nr:sensor histidine kinase [Chloroflexota bacterium]